MFESFIAEVLAEEIDEGMVGVVVEEDDDGDGDSGDEDPFSLLRLFP